LKEKGKVVGNGFEEILTGDEREVFVLEIMPGGFWY